MPEYLSSEDLRALDTNSNGSNVFTANKTIPCIIPNPIRHLENVAVCTYGVLVSIFGMLDQVYLYYTVDHVSFHFMACGAGWNCYCHNDICYFLETDT